jgi:aryl-alcohol dehydrogenase-like predicted oxidoreductase
MYNLGPTCVGRDAASYRWRTISNKHQLNTGAKIPAIGLGTWQSKPGEVREAVKAALQAGYRHIDTALAYGNEKEVGEGIKDSGVPREQIWITTKLDNPWHKRVEEGIESSLKSLGVDYVDLYLMVSLQRNLILPHWLTQDCSTGLHQPTPTISRSTCQTGISSTHGLSFRSSLRLVA